MAVVTMPQLGESVTEGTVLKWLKAPGERVELDDPLCEIETEKVTAELPSPFEGTMGAIAVAEGVTVPIGALLCEVDEGVGAAVPAQGAPLAGAGGGNGAAWSGGPMAIPPDEGSPPPEPPVAATVAAPAVAASPPPAGPKTTQPDGRQRFYSPAVLRLAGEHQVDLAAIHGSGIDGRVTRTDVEAHLAARTATPTAAAQGSPRPAQTPARAGTAYDVVELTATRRTIAAHLKRSNLEAPQAWTMVEADVTALVRRREAEKVAFLEREGVELTLLPYFAVAVCETLRDFPALNARWEGDELRRYHGIGLGVAVAAEQGLVVPTVANAGDLNLAGMARGIRDIVQRARERKLRVEDVEGGTFTVNNTGAFGSIASKPIVNWPQVAIVTMERAVKRAVVTEGDAIAIRWMMNVCLSFDHRAMDGLEAGSFLAALRRRLES